MFFFHALLTSLSICSKNIKRGVGQRCGKISKKKESNRNTKHSGRAFQQTRTSGRQNLRAEDKIEFKVKEKKS
jgi:hypothetical protein